MSDAEGSSPKPVLATLGARATHELPHHGQLLPVKPIPIPVSWTVELAGQQVPVPGGYGIAMAVDASDSIHLAYWDFQLGTLIYVARSGNAWSPRTVIDTVNYDGRRGGYFTVAMALDPGGHVHVCYFNCLTGDLKHAWCVNGTWNVEVVQPGVGTTYLYAAMTFDANGALHVLYTDFAVYGTPSFLKYVVKTSSGWSSPVGVDPGLPGAGSTALAIDSRGNLHAVCGSRDALRYYRKWPGGVWSMYHEIERQNLGSFGHVSIALDSRDMLHVAYTDSYNQCIKYAAMHVSWSAPQVLAPSGPYGRSSIATTAGGDVSVVVYNSASKTLEVIRGKTGEWDSPEVVDAVQDSGACCQVALDSHGSPHVSYFRTVGETPLNPGTHTVRHAFLAPIRSTPPG